MRSFEGVRTHAGGGKQAFSHLPPAGSPRTDAFLSIEAAVSYGLHSMRKTLLKKLVLIANRIGLMPSDLVMT